MPARSLVDVRLDAVATRGGPPPELRDVSVHVRHGEFFTFLGPPHSGKTAMLRVVAGLQAMERGRVVVDGEDLGSTPARRRRMGFVFHEGALWPHLTVRDHVAFGLEQLGLDGADVDGKVRTVLARLGLTDVARRRPGGLTTDHRRRLALARALAVEPRVLLLDEPLAHLDPAPRKSLRLELAKLHRDLAVTTLCATRDAADALALSDRLGVVVDGRVVQVGTPEDVYRHPVNRAVAEALGPVNFLPVRVVEMRDLGVVVETERGDHVPVPGIGVLREGSRGLLVLRPETLGLADAAQARGPGVRGRIALRVFEGARHLYEVDIGASAPVRVEVPSAGAHIFRLNEHVRVELSSETVALIRDDTVSGRDDREPAV